ncbi:cathepsin B [Histomonas meleagridis]|uniref:cathepsin B n=1 Tax=Histomonas meleagridis TaxID=135588 RepID=UPI003559C239|nr:cathepsin B [Histomonas meleagridis]KAH0805061.1 cathepsin B [Histomonas meleagridis]
MLLLFICFLEDYVENSEILKALKKEKGIPWVAGNNERFHGLSFQDARILSGPTSDIDKLRPETIPLSPSPSSTFTIPGSYNFSEKYPKCDFGPMDQGKCGSCWAFSVAKSFSHRYCQKYGHLSIFSPAHLVGCDRRNAGCQGGTLIPAWRYIDLKGIPLETCQPYEINSTSFNCSRRKCFNETTPFEAKKSVFWSAKRFDSIPAMQYSIITDGPITTSMKVFADFMYYKSGIYTHLKGDNVGLHAVEIIGWGEKDKTPYWIVSNSWGTNWGMNGSFLIKRGVNECGIEDYVVAGEVI